MRVGRRVRGRPAGCAGSSVSTPFPLYCLRLLASHGEGGRPQAAMAALGPSRPCTSTPRGASPGSVLGHTQPGTP